MALEATHIKFALDIKGLYQVSDIPKYLIGTVYPDSRYVTGINREKTHFEDLLSPGFPIDDFKKGWAVHHLCDSVGKETMDIIFPDLFEGAGSGGQGSELWIRRTAIKVVQDIITIKDFNIQPYLQILDSAENPNGEPIEKILEYHKIIMKMYSDKKEITIQDAYTMWLSFGIDEELVKRIEKISEKYLGDSSVFVRIKQFYDEMLVRARRVIRFEP